MRKIRISVKDVLSHLQTAVAGLALMLVASLPGVSQVFSINENLPFGSLVGTVDAETLSGLGNLTFTITDGNTANAFDLEMMNGELRVASPAALDFEQNPTFALQVKVTHAAGQSSEVSLSKELTVNVVDVAEAPQITTGEATVLSDVSATIAGELNDSGLITVVGVQLGTSPTLSDLDPAKADNPQTYVPNLGIQTYSHTFKGLAAGTTYYYRLIGENSAGRTYGAVRNFQTYSIPSVSAISLIGPSTINSTTAQFLVNFTEGVSGVDVGDFTIQTSNTANGAIASVTRETDQRYFVEINTISGDGFLELSFMNNGTVTSLNGVATNSDFTFGPYYTIDNTLPALQITGPSYPFTQISPITYIVSYRDFGSGIDEITLSSDDITLISTGTATGTIEVAGTGNSQRTVRITNISGDGRLSIQIVAGTATDRAGNAAPSAGPSNTVIVDNTAPQGICPAAITVTASGSRCNANIAVPLPTYDDSAEIGVVVIKNDKTGTPNASGTYPVGVTEVIWTFIDQSGNEGKCSTLITVEDKEAPVIIVPANMVVSADVDQCSAIVNFDVTAEDNCTGVTLTAQSPELASGSRFPIGTSTLNYTATDNAGNTASASFTVTVIDDKGPVIACLDDITVSSESGKNGALVNFPKQVSAVDNCSGDSEVTITQIAGVASGAFFPSGSTVNTFEAVDALGNKSQCSFTVIVQDTEDPYLIISEPSKEITQTEAVTYTLEYFLATRIALTESDITLNKTGTANGTISISSPTEFTRLITISNLSGDGTLGISVAAGTAFDPAENFAPAAGPSETFRVDNSAPSLSIAKLGVATNEDIATSPVPFQVSDAVSQPADLIIEILSDNNNLVSAEGLTLGGVGANRTLVVQPNKDASGSATITITVTDEAGLAISQHLQLTVNAVADAPAITTTNANGNEDTAIALDFKANLQDTDGSEAIAYYIVENLPEGALLSAGTQIADGNFQLSLAEILGLTVTPAPDFVGNFTLQVKAASKENSNNNEAISEPEDLVVTVLPINDAPEFELDAISLVLDEDFGESKINVSPGTFKDADTNLEDITFTISPDPAAIGFVDVTINATTGEITFTSIADSNRVAPFEFTVTANDGAAENATFSQTFTLKINPVNDVPQIMAEPNPWVLKEDFEEGATISVLRVDEPLDEQNEVYTYAIVNKSLADIADFSIDPASGVITAKAKQDQNGVVMLTIVANDGVNNSAPYTLEVQVNAVADEPVLNFENIIVVKEGFEKATRTVSVELPANEADREFSYTISEDPDPENLKVIISQETGELTIQMVEQDFYTDKDITDGLDGLNYTVTITEQNKEAITVDALIVVENVNDAPVYIGSQNPLVVNGIDGEDLASSIEDLFFDADDDMLVYTLSSEAPNYLAVNLTSYVKKVLEWKDATGSCEPYTFDLIVADPSGEKADVPVELNIRFNEGTPKLSESKVETYYGVESFAKHLEIEGFSGKITKVELLDYNQSVLSNVVIAQVPEGGYLISGTIRKGFYGSTNISIAVDYSNVKCPADFQDNLNFEVDVKVTEVYADIPTLFTPNGDGANDTWNILNLEKFSGFSVTVYDRRGKTLWQSASNKNYQEWNGTINGALAPEGEYFYRLDLEGKAPQTSSITIKGVITLIY